MVDRAHPKKEHQKKSRQNKVKALSRAPNEKANQILREN